MNLNTKGFLETINNAQTQVYVVALVCFLCPGMFNALNSLSTDNLTQANLKYQQNAALYACFALMGLIAGGLNNLLGPRVLLVVGGSTYAIYAASQYVIHLTQYTVETVVTISNSTGTFIIPKTVVLVPEATGAFAVAAGGVLGIGAGMLWAAQGQIVMTYPTESQKGTYFAKFWVIFNLGTVLGSVIALGESYNSGTNPASNSLYIIFIGLMACGSAAALLIVSPSRVIREDHSQVQSPPTNVSREFVGILRLFIDPAMIVLFVPCLSSNWFYTYQFGNVQAYFDTRTCAFNNIFYWTSQMAGSWILGNMFLDNPRQNRIKRAWMGAIILSSSTLLVWGVGAVFQYSWNTRTLHEGDFVKQPLEWIGPFILYVSYGAYDAFFQTYSYWLIGALSNDSEKLSRYAGFYKGVQSGGAALSWGLGAMYPDWDGITWFWVTTIPMIASCICFAVFVSLFVKNTNLVEEWRELEDGK